MEKFVPNIVGYSFDSNKRLVKHEASIDGLRKLSLQPSWFEEDVKIAACWDTAEERIHKSPWLLDEAALQPRSGNKVLIHLLELPC